MPPFTFEIVGALFILALTLYLRFRSQRKENKTHRDGEKTRRPPISPVT